MCEFIGKNWHAWVVTVSTVSTVYSKIHSATVKYVTGAIHTYIVTITGIERGTNKYNYQIILIQQTNM
jgi:hypothetical protein